MSKPPPSTTDRGVGAICSFLLPGLGQIVRGRVLRGLFYLVLVPVLYIVGVATFGVLLPVAVIVHLGVIIGAAL